MTTKFFKSNKKDIKSIPFHILAEEYDKIALASETKEELLAKWKEYFDTKKNKMNWVTVNSILAHSASWIYPQIMALLAQHTLPLTTEGQVDCASYWKENLNSKDMWQVGLFRFLMIYPRGLTVSGQSKQPGIQYSGLVPIVLAAHKLHNDTPYSLWDRETIDKVVNLDLAQAMQCIDYKDYTQEELLEFRNEGLLHSSGTLKPILSTWKLNKVGDYDWDKLPPLARTMLTQIWIANPALRTKYMVLDPRNWDNIPAPLIDGEVLVPVAKEEKYREESPW